MGANQNALDRLNAMVADGQQTWDLSPNDVAALKWAIRRIEEANRNVISATSKKVFDDSKRVVFPMVALPWSSLATESGLPIAADSQMNAIGFIPVYEDIQSLIEDHGHDKEYGTFVI